MCSAYCVPGSRLDLTECRRLRVSLDVVFELSAGLCLRGSGPGAPPWPVVTSGRGNVPQSARSLRVVAGFPLPRSLKGRLSTRPGQHTGGAGGAQDGRSLELLVHVMAGGFQGLLKFLYFIFIINMTLLSQLNMFF